MRIGANHDVACVLGSTTVASPERPGRWVYDSAQVLRSKFAASGVDDKDLDRKSTRLNSSHPV